MSAGPKATTSITITLVTGAGAGPFTINIPAAFATIPGLGGADSFIRDIFVRGGFWSDPDSGTFYPASQIASIATA